MAHRLEGLAINAYRRTSLRLNQITNKPSPSLPCNSTCRSYNSISVSQLRPIVPYAMDNFSRQAVVSAPRRNFHSTMNLNDDASSGGGDDGGAVKTAPFTSPKVEELFNKIIWLDMVEVHLLAELINEKMGLKISDAERERMARGGGGGGGGGGNKAEDGEEGAAAAEEKTAFDLKLTGFDAKAKIKVIKEIRAITSLGLKEAKELVEGAPSIVKKDIKKEEAEELKAKLEGLGATVEIA